ncbi:hypothetical protein ACIBQ1_30515 [Nonomuraea sp. NPDC050153]|uniref:hypothetical protein n=1 Tax=Nonomuraea sp. NPDC050153 TaxID=3364359 RepID=UPI00378825D6
MFKRRLALLGAVAVLAVTGLTGSALADEAPPTAGAKVTCKTADGVAVQIAEAVPGIPGKIATRGGKVRVTEPDGKLKVDALPDGEAPPLDLAKALPAPQDGEDPVTTVRIPEDGEALVLTATPIPDGELPEGGQAAPAQPAKPGEAPTGEPLAITKTVKIVCEKAD